MPLYICTGRDNYGNRVTRKVEMETWEQAVEYMKACGCVTTKVKKATLFDIEISRNVTKRDISVFCRQFSYMASSGVQIIEALEMIRNQTKSRRINQALSNMTADILKGKPFSESMKRHKEFPELLVNMTYVGELTGDLGNVYISMADYYEREYGRSEEIKSAMTYPAVVSVIMLLVILIAVIYLVPNYVSIYEANSARIPLPTAVLIWISGFFSKHLTTLIAALTVVTVGFFILLRTSYGRFFWGGFKLTVPLYRQLYKKSLNATFTDVMSILLNATYPITDSLTTVKRVLNNPYLDKGFDTIIAKVQSGSGLSAAMEPFKFFDRNMCGILKIGEESGHLVSAIDNCAKSINTEFNAMVAKFGKLIEPMIILVLGLILAFVMLAIMLPAFNVGNIL